MKRKITVVAGLHLTSLDRKMINAALDAGQKEIHTRRGNRISKSLILTRTTKKAEMEEYRLCTWQWQRAGDVEKHNVKGKLYHAEITDPKRRVFHKTLDISEI